MPHKRLKLTFPEGQIRRPVIGEMTKKFDVMPNVRRARVTETEGEMVLDLEGPEAALDAAVEFLHQNGLEVEPLEGDLVGP